MLAALGIAVGAVVVLVVVVADLAAGHASQRRHTDVTLTGRACAEAAVPLALVAAAGLIAVALVRNWARRLLAVLIAAAGVGVLIAVIRVDRRP